MLDWTVITAELERIGDSDDLSFEEIKALVSDASQVEDQVMYGSPGPRRRFPNPNDRGAISKIRNRLNPIWMQNRVLQGDLTGHDRAVHCGELYGRRCTDCGVISCNGSKKRNNCHQRLHPICMGVNARKPFYTNDGGTKLDNEESLAIYVINLGAFDIGDAPPQWAAGASSLISRAYDWQSSLVRRADAPDCLTSSFASFRADLHQGYLSLDMVIVGAPTEGAVDWLVEQFSNATENDVQVEEISCPSAQECVATFGNLMSSCVIYSDTDECQALMEAFKGRRLVQARGRFYNKGKAPESEAVASEDTEAVDAEKPSHRIGGSPSPKCPECGGPTEAIGWLSGNWTKVSAKSGERYWHLPPQPE